MWIPFEILNLRKESQLEQGGFSCLSAKPESLILIGICIQYGFLAVAPLKEKARPARRAQRRVNPGYLRRHNADKRPWNGGRPGFTKSLKRGSMKKKGTYAHSDQS